MTPDNHYNWLDLPSWRLRKIRLGFVGSECPHCNNKMISEKEVCPKCLYKTRERTLASGTVEFIHEHAENGSPRFFEVSLSTDSGAMKVNIIYNGRHRILGVKLGMKARLTVLESMNGEPDIYDIAPLNQPASEANPTQESSKSSK